MPWIDIAFFVILAIMAIIGCYKGFLQSLIALCGTLVTLVLAIWLSKPANGLLESWFGLNSALGDALSGTVSGYCSGTLPWLMQKLAELIMGGHDALVEAYPNSSGTAGEYWTNTAFAGDFSVALGSLIGVVITVIIIYILIKIVLWLLSKLFDVITRNKAISSLDRLLGFLIGAAKGCVFCFILLSVVYLLSSMIPSVGTWFTDLLTISPVSAEIYKWTCEILEGTIIPFFTGG